MPYASIDTETRDTHFEKNTMVWDILSFLGLWKFHQNYIKDHIKDKG
jgi:hypothetical protein